MVCEKCGYTDKKEVILRNIHLCSICASFSPEKENNFRDYINEKVGWKLLDTFRKYNQKKGQKQKAGMKKIALTGKAVTRAPLGYSIVDGNLAQNEDSAKVHSLFKTFLVRNYSLNSLAKNYGLSVNGIKKILTNRTYLGELKFDGQINKGSHKPIISAEIFYAVQRKLKNYLKPRKNLSITSLSSGSSL